MENGCLAKNYLPIPPRLWERSQATCNTIFRNIDENGMVFVPYFNKKVPVSKLGEVLKMLYKGNILQYPSPDTKIGGITKKLNYARIVNGYGKNRKKTWASQTDSITIPNTSSLQRINYSITSNNIGGEIQLDHPPFFIDSRMPPFTKAETGDFPELTPPVKPIPFAYPLTKVAKKLENSIINGGKLICLRENGRLPCFPTSASDVPGPIINLCYPSNAPAFYPRQRKTYTNNATKWPINGITSIPAYNSN